MDNLLDNLGPAYHGLPRLSRANVEVCSFAKTQGTSVIGGTLNQTGAFNFTATAVGADTALARIMQLVQNAQASKAPAQRIADTALGQAEVGIALGAGTDVAVQTADVVLVKNDPSDVANSIHLAQKVRGKIKQNLFWAAIYNVIAIPVAAGVLYRPFGLLLRPEWSAFAMSVSTVTVTLNALLLNRVRLKQYIGPVASGPQIQGSLRHGIHCLLVAACVIPLRDRISRSVS